MQERGPIKEAMLRYGYATSVEASIRALISNIQAHGMLAGYTLLDLPEHASAVRGFDLKFADRHLRIVFTGSTLPSGHIAIECVALPVAYGSTVRTLGVVEVDISGGFNLPDDQRQFFVSNIMDVYGLIGHFVGLSTNASQPFAKEPR